MLHVINSCIVKLGKLVAVSKVYRGVVGGVLPDSFWTWAACQPALADHWAGSQPSD